MLKKLKENKKIQPMAAILVCFTIIAVFLFIVAAPTSQAQGSEIGLNYASNLGLPSSDGDIRVTIVNIVKYFLTFIGLALSVTALIRHA